MHSDPALAGVARERAADHGPGARHSASASSSPRMSCRTPWCRHERPRRPDQPGPPAGRARPGAFDALGPDRHPLGIQVAIDDVDGTGRPATDEELAAVTRAPDRRPPMVTLAALAAAARPSAAPRSVPSRHLRRAPALTVLTGGSLSPPIAGPGNRNPGDPPGRPPNPPPAWWWLPERAGFQPRATTRAMRSHPHGSPPRGASCAPACRPARTAPALPAGRPARTGRHLPVRRRTFNVRPLYDRHCTCRPPRCSRPSPMRSAAWDAAMRTPLLRRPHRRPLDGLGTDRLRRLHPCSASTAHSPTDHGRPHASQRIPTAHRPPRLHQSAVRGAGDLPPAHRRGDAPDSTGRSCACRRR